MDAAFELGVFGEGEEALEVGAGGVSRLNQVVAGEEEWGANFFFGDGFVFFFREIVEVEAAVAGEAVHAVQNQVFGEAAEAEEALEG